MFVQVISIRIWLCLCLWLYPNMAIWPPRPSDFRGGLFDLAQEPEIENGCGDGDHKHGDLRGQGNATGDRSQRNFQFLLVIHMEL